MNYITLVLATCLFCISHAYNMTINKDYPLGVTYTTNKVYGVTQNLTSKSYGCVAPPLVMGGVCHSDEALWGTLPTTVVCYAVEPLGDTTLECNGLGLSCDFSGACCRWKMHSLGYMHEGSYCLLWGATAAKPAIQCAGKVLGSLFQWTWSSSTVGTISCNGICPNENCSNCGNPC